MICKIEKRWYIMFPVARRMRRSIRADMTSKILRPAFLKAFRFWKKSKKIQKTVCKNKKWWYIMFPVARRTRQRSEADITPRKIVNRNLKNFPVLKKIEKNFKKRFAKTKIDDILCFCCASNATKQRGWYNTEKFAICSFEKLPVLKKSKKIQKSGLQK